MKSFVPKIGALKFFLLFSLFYPCTHKWSTCFCSKIFGTQFSGKILILTCCSRCLNKNLTILFRCWLKTFKKRWKTALGAIMNVCSIFVALLRIGFHLCESSDIFAANKESIKPTGKNIKHESIACRKTLFNQAKKAKFSSFPAKQSSIQKMPVKTKYVPEILLFSLVASRENDIFDWVVQRLIGFVIRFWKSDVLRWVDFARGIANQKRQIWCPNPTKNGILLLF